MKDQERPVEVPNHRIHTGRLQIFQELLLDGEGKASEGNLGLSSRPDLIPGCLHVG